jgi:hypothetical protein
VYPIIKWVKCNFLLLLILFIKEKQTIPSCVLFLNEGGEAGNQGGPSLKDPLQVSDGPITRSRAKKIKEAMQGLVQSTWDEASKSPTIKVGLKEGEPILIHLIQAVEDMT